MNELDVTSNVVAAKAARLRQDLGLLPPSPGTVSFVGSDLVTSRRSFFPGGSGLRDEKRQSISTIVLGSDWGNEVSLEDALGAAPGAKHKEASTILATDRILERAEFDVADCWYSNAWPVMRCGDTEESEYHPMRDNPALTDACRQFLRTCIEAFSPRLIVTMGIGPAWFVGPFVGDRWMLSKAEVSYFCDSKQMEREPVKKDGIVYVAITHASQPQNAKYRGMPQAPWGRENEVALLRRARELAGIKCF